MAYKNAHIEIKCQECGSMFTTHQGTYKKHLRKGTVIRCTNCNKKYKSDLEKQKWSNMSEDQKSELKSKMSEGTKKQWEKVDKEKRKEINEKISQKRKAYWENLSEEEIEEIRKRKEEWWNSLSEEERLKHRDLRRDGLINYWENISDEERERHREISKFHSIQFWENVTEEDKSIRNNKISKSQKERWDNMSEKEYIFLCSRMADIKYEYWRNLPEDERKRQTSLLRSNWNDYYKTLSDEDKIQIRDRLLKGYREWYNNLSEEEKKIWSSNIAKAWINMSQEDFEKAMFKAQYSRSLNIRVTETESQFISLLTLYNIEYEFQYLLENFNNKEFQEKYKINPLNDKRVSPHHTWDFMVNLNGVKILIDVDGSIHNYSTMNFEILSKNKMVKFNELVQYKDKQRSLQNKGFETYIIIAYNDIIRQDTLVYDIIEDKYILFEDFIKYLDMLNNLEKGLNE